MAGYVIKVTIEDTHPPVWRRLLIPQQISFACLHEILQTAFGWENEHMHEFTPSQSDIQISDQELECWGTLLPEDKTAVDSFLHDYKWIRYIYDFGDDWRHKIVCEKEEPDYKERHAVILKAKGDNFEEDSGGVWGQDARLPFDLEKTNERLARKNCPVVKESRKAKKAISQEKQVHELEDRVRELAKRLRQQEEVYQTAFSQIQRKQVEISQMQRKQEAWYDFFWEAENQRKGEHYVLRVRKSQRSSREYLQQLSADEVKDYCGNLGIPRETFAKMRPVDALWECLQSHPEYYLYVLDEDVVDYGREILAHKEGEIPFPEFSEQVSRLIDLGLVYPEFQQEKKRKEAILSVASDMEELFAHFTEEFCERTYQMLEQCGESIYCYMMVYGLVPVDVLYEQYRETFDKSMEKEDFLRVVYWYCCCNDMIRSYTADESNVSYVGMIELDPVQVVEQQARYGENLEYRSFTKKELLPYGKTIGEIYLRWHELGICLSELAYMETEDVEDVVTDCYFEALYCKNREELAGFLEDFYTPATLGEQIALWHILTKICLDTRLPGLKGYTRREYGKLVHKSPFQITTVDVSIVKEAVEADTFLSELPLELQQELLDATEITDVSLRQKALERLLRKVGVDNAALLYEMTVCYLEGGKFGRAEKPLDRLLKLCPEDESVQGLEERLTNGVMREVEEARGYGFDLWPGDDEEVPFRERTAAMPYQRAERKIGRNEPCPCGSGKKYKHCCGRNA